MNVQTVLAAQITFVLKEGLDESINEIGGISTEALPCKAFMKIVHRHFVNFIYRF